MLTHCYKRQPAQVLLPSAKDLFVSAASADTASKSDADQDGKSRA